MGEGREGLDGAAGIDGLELGAVLDGKWDSLTLSTAMVSLNPHNEGETWRVEPVKRKDGKEGEGLSCEVMIEDK